VQGAAAAGLFQLSAVARRAFDLAADPERIALALRADPVLAPLAARRPGLRIPGAWDPFECAVRALLERQAAGPGAGCGLAARLVARAGEEIVGGGDGLTHLFPSPSALARVDLGGLGLDASGQAALRGLAAAVDAGALDLAGPVDDVTAALGALPGLGPSAAQHVALRALGEPDAFPGDEVAPALAARAEAWRPWRGYAVAHLWEAMASESGER
jgi:AraC family transcriptional regulator, regulatory protein of adaptative response / DNA-3-methyladenine glycosylase II